MLAWSGHRAVLSRSGVQDCPARRAKSRAHAGSTPVEIDPISVDPGRSLASRMPHSAGSGRGLAEIGRRVLGVAPTLGRCWSNAAQTRPASESKSGASAFGPKSPKSGRSRLGDGLLGVNAWSGYFGVDLASTWCRCGSFRGRCPTGMGAVCCRIGVQLGSMRGR